MKLLSGCQVVDLGKGREIVTVFRLNIYAQYKPFTEVPRFITR